MGGFEARELKAFLIHMTNILPFLRNQILTEEYSNKQAKESRFERPGFMSWRLLGHTQLPQMSLQDQRHSQGCGGPTRTGGISTWRQSGVLAAEGVVNLPSKHDSGIPIAEKQSTAFLLRQGKSCQPNYKKLFTE